MSDMQLFQIASRKVRYLDTFNFQNTRATK